MGKQVLRNENLFFILSDILFAEQVSIERNNPVIVIFRHLLPLLPNLYFISCLSLIFLYVMFSLLFFMSCSGLFSLQSPSGFFSMSCSGLTRTSMDPRVALRLPEDDKEEKRMPEDDAFLSVIAGLIFLSVIAGLGPAIQEIPGSSPGMT